MKISIWCEPDVEKRIHSEDMSSVEKKGKKEKKEKKKEEKRRKIRRKKEKIWVQFDTSCLWLSLDLFSKHIQKHTRKT